MYYKEQDKKVSSKTFRENFGYGAVDNKSKDNKWMWWLLGILFAIAIVLIVLWVMKKKNSAKPAMGYKFF